MIEAWLIPKGHDPNDVRTPMAVQLVACEGTRILQLEGCTVSVISVFPDDTAYVITRKTFEKQVIDAARRKWKMQTYMHHYGSNPYAQQQAWQNAYQGGFDPSAQQQQQASPDDFEKYVRDAMNDLWRK